MDGELCFDRPVTVVALKRLGASVFAVVPCQLVAPGKSPLATLPRALVRLLTWGLKKQTHKMYKHLFHQSSTNRTHICLLWQCKKTSVAVVRNHESKYLQL